MARWKGGFCRSLPAAHKHMCVRRIGLRSMRTRCSPSGKGNTHSRTGNSVPVRGASSGRGAKRLGGDALQRAEDSHPANRTPGTKPDRRSIDEATDRPEKLTTRGRVTIATPAKLDFKTLAMSEIEGCADTMSARSDVSMGARVHAGKRSSCALNRCDSQTRVAPIFATGVMHLPRTHSTRVR